MRAVGKWLWVHGVRILCLACVLCTWVIPNVQSGYVRVSKELRAREYREYQASVARAQEEAAAIVGGKDAEPIPVTLTFVRYNVSSYGSDWFGFSAQKVLISTTLVYSQTERTLVGNTEVRQREMPYQVTLAPKRDLSTEDGVELQKGLAVRMYYQDPVGDAEFESCALTDSTNYLRFMTEEAYQEMLAENFLE